jgi:hypothetical protein
MPRWQMETVFSMWIFFIHFIFHFGFWFWFWFWFWKLVSIGIWCLLIGTRTLWLLAIGFGPCYFYKHVSWFWVPIPPRNRTNNLVPILIFQNDKFFIPNSKSILIWIQFSLTKIQTDDSYLPEWVHTQDWSELAIQGTTIMQWMNQLFIIIIIISTMRL